MKFSKDDVAPPTSSTIMLLISFHLSSVPIKNRMIVVHLQESRATPPLSNYGLKYDPLVALPAHRACFLRRSRGAGCDCCVSLGCVISSLSTQPSLPRPFLLADQLVFDDIDVGFTHPGDVERRSEKIAEPVDLQLQFLSEFSVAGRSQKEMWKEVRHFVYVERQYGEVTLYQSRCWDDIRVSSNLPLFSSTLLTSLPRLFKRYSNSSTVPFFPAAFLRAFRRVLDVTLRKQDLVTISLQTIMLPH
jgi:hypothetical protein